MNKPKCVLTVDVEALSLRAADHHVDTLIYGNVGGQEYGIGKMMDIADKHNVRMTFFLDFAECELYGDSILEVGRYIESRGHDLEVHCHYDLLDKIVGKKPWVSITENYYSWYRDDDDSKKAIDYVTDKYLQCTGRMPVAFRGGEYRFGIGVLKALKDKGYKADMSYNFVRPLMLSANRQFVFENGLIEIPLGILKNRKPLNFNYVSLVPENESDYKGVIKEYKNLFKEYYSYYGDDAIATVLMHSWSFMFQRDRFEKSGYIDRPNEVMADFFDVFITEIKQNVDFVSVKEAVEDMDIGSLKKVDFNSVFRKNYALNEKQLLRINNFIKEKAGDRDVIIWGKGWTESTVFQTVNFHKSLNTAFYFSNDAHSRPVWRGKPVHKFGEIDISPQKYYVFVVAQSSFSEIRDSLRELGFKDYEDFYDIQRDIPTDVTNGIKKQMDFICPICGESVFETYNSVEERRCSCCGSVERTRTFPKLFNENVKADFAKIKILHVSPMKAERIFFNNMGANVTTIDIRPEVNADITGDISNMPEVKTESFDMVFASCVLNHVFYEKKALSEIVRVLKKGGQAIFFVLDSGTLRNTVVEGERSTSWYGQENFEKYKVGTFRRYGEVDFVKELGGYFAQVRCYEKYDEVTDSSVKWYVGTK